MTIYDIAEMAGVSASSVSRVINGKPGVSKAKREKIQELLRKYHYAPDENARSLVNQSNKTIGILTDAVDSLQMNEGTAIIQHELLSNGYYCFVKYIGEGEDAVEEGVADLARRRVEGALLLGARFCNHDVVKKAVKRYLPDVPVILVHQTERVELDNVYCAGAEERKGLIRCVEHMAKKGRKNLVLMVDAGRASASVIREGFEAGVKAHPEMRGWVYMGVDVSVDAGAKAVRRARTEHPELDGIICSQDMIAIGAMNELLDQGIRVPQQISVMGERNLSLCEVCRPKLTSLDTMLPMSTLMSARMLLDVLSQREPPHRVTLEMEVVEREST